MRFLLPEGEGQDEGKKERETTLPLLTLALWEREFRTTFSQRQNLYRQYRVVTIQGYRGTDGSQE
jgi:hypothetical protein